MNILSYLFKRVKYWIKSFSLSELRGGMGVTGQELLNEKITVQFPEERTPISPRFRGIHAQMRYDSGEERCIACKLCEAVCPANAITIESAEDEKGVRRTTRYDIDLFKCIFCGFCEEACPVDAIVETDMFDYHFESREGTVINKEQLLAIGDKYKQKIEAQKTADSPYR